MLKVSGNDENIGISITMKFEDLYTWQVGLLTGITENVLTNNTTFEAVVGQVRTIKDTAITRNISQEQAKEYRFKCTLLKPYGIRDF